MFHTGEIALLISFSSAIASAGAFGIQARRLRMEAALLTLSLVRLRETDADRIEVSVLNVGSRPAYDLEISCSALRDGSFLEGLKAGGDAFFTLELPARQCELVLSYSDGHSGRLTDRRVLNVAGDRVEIGRRRRSRSIRAGDLHALSDGRQVVVAADQQIASS